MEELTNEADERHRQKGASTGVDANESTALKDVWRPDLDIRTAIRARISADQAPRIAALEAELAELQEQNRASEERVNATEAQTAVSRARVVRALELLGKVRGVDIHSLWLV